MPDKANVTSVEAIEDFRAKLVIYISKARPALEEVSSDVLRLRLWLENDQRMALEGLARRRRKEFDNAQAALTSARMAIIKHETSAEQLAVTRARRSLEESETKLKRVKYWDREFSTVVEPMAKQLEKLHTVLANDMGKAVAHLAKIIHTLSQYADIHPTAGQDQNAGGGLVTPAPNATSETPPPSPSTPDEVRS
jgi:hypothetical protein